MTLTLFRGRILIQPLNKVKVISTTALHLTLNISETVTDSKGPSTGNGIWAIKWTRDQWRHVTPTVLEIETWVSLASCTIRHRHICIHAQCRYIYLDQNCLCELFMQLLVRSALPNLATPLAGFSRDFPGSSSRGWNNPWLGAYRPRLYAVLPENIYDSPVAVCRSIWEKYLSQTRHAKISNQSQ